VIALSIRQPWAWLIVRPDITDPGQRIKAMLDGRIKTIENRTWPTRYRGPILIHAGKGMTRAEYEDVEEMMFGWSNDAIELPPFEHLPRGGILGRARIVDCVMSSGSPWFYGPFGFVLDDIEPLPFRPYRGALGFFDVPADEGVTC
jgi:hypothetical protein